MTQTMVQPSSLLAAGLKRVMVDGHLLFRFTDELQARLEELVEKSKAQALDTDEAAELAGLAELDRIFTFVNAELALG